MSVTADSKLKYYDMELALDLDKAYYAAIAFVMVLFAGWLITKLVVIFADSLRYKRLRFLGGYDWAVAGVLNVILMYINLYMFFMILSMIPFATIQNLFEMAQALLRLLFLGLLQYTDRFDSLLVQILKHQGS